MDIEVKFVDNGMSDPVMEKRIKRLAIDIMRRYGITTPIPIHITTALGANGAYYYNPRKIVINPYLSLVNNPYGVGKYFYRKFREVSRFKPDELTFVLAHELAHYKQDLDGIFSLKRESVTDGHGVTWAARDIRHWKGKPDHAFKARHYHKTPWEVDANAKAKEVVREMHFESLERTIKRRRKRK